MASAEADAENAAIAAMTGADDATFHTGVFFEQFMWQLSFPISLPLLYAVRGYSAVRNMMFWPIISSSAVFVLRIIVTSAALASFALWLIELSSHSSYSTTMSATLACEALLAIMLLVYYRITIALKYAYMSRVHYQLIMRSTTVPFDLMMAEQIASCVIG